MKELEHVDDSYGACVFCREYVPYTDEEFNLVKWPCAVAQLAALRADTARLPDISWCECDFSPIYGVKEGRHLPSCPYGIVMDFLDIPDPRVEIKEGN